MNRIFFLPAICILCWLYPVFCFAEVYRSEPKIAPVKVYKSMLESYKQKKYRDVERAINYIKPVTETIKSKLDVDIEPKLKSSLKAKDGSFYKAVGKLIYYDIQIILSALNKKMEAKYPGETKVWFKMAYENYLLLSSDLLKEKVDFDADMRIKKLFNQAYRYLGTESPYSEKTPPDWKSYKKHSDDIIKEIAKSYPELSFYNRWMTAHCRLDRYNDIVEKPIVLCSCTPLACYYTDGSNPRGCDYKDLFQHYQYYNTAPFCAGMSKNLLCCSI